MFVRMQAYTSSSLMRLATATVVPVSTAGLSTKSCQERQRRIWIRIQMQAQLRYQTIKRFFWIVFTVLNAFRHVARFFGAHSSHVCSLRSFWCAWQNDAPQDEQVHSPHAGQILRPHCHTLHDNSWVCGHAGCGVKKQNTSIIYLVRQILKRVLLTASVWQGAKKLCVLCNTGFDGKAWALELCEAAVSAVFCEGSVERTGEYVH